MTLKWAAPWNNHFHHEHVVTGFTHLYTCVQSLNFNVTTISLDVCHKWHAEEVRHLDIRYRDFNIGWYRSRTLTKINFRLPKWRFITLLYLYLMIFFLSLEEPNKILTTCQWIWIIVSLCGVSMCPNNNRWQTCIYLQSRMTSGSSMSLTGFCPTLIQHYISHSCGLEK